MEVPYFVKISDVARMMKWRPQKVREVIKRGLVNWGEYYTLNNKNTYYIYSKKLMKDIGKEVVINYYNSKITDN